VSLQASCACITDRIESVLIFLPAVNVQTKIIGKKSACTLIVGIRHSKKYTIMACWAKVKFSAQKGHEQMMVTFSKVAL